MRCSVAWLHRRWSKCWLTFAWKPYSAGAWRFHVLVGCSAKQHRGRYTHGSPDRTACGHECVVVRNKRGRSGSYALAWPGSCMKLLRRRSGGSWAKRMGRDHVSCGSAGPSYRAGAQLGAQQRRLRPRSNAARCGHGGQGQGSERGRLRDHVQGELLPMGQHHHTGAAALRRVAS
jgi:hypothetical protein